MKTNAHVGSSFDDLLQAEGIFAEVTASAVERVVAWQIDEARQNENEPLRRSSN